MQTGHDQVPRQARLDGDLGGFQVTRLSHQDFVRILTEKRPEGAGKGQTDAFIGRDLDDSLQLVLHRILHRQDFGVDRVDPSEAGIEGRGFSRSVGPVTMKIPLGFSIVSQM